MATDETYRDIQREITEMEDAEEARAVRRRIRGLPEEDPDRESLAESWEMVRLAKDIELD